jgi:hypothetical protein
MRGMVLRVIHELDLRPEGSNRWVLAALAHLRPSDYHQ